eukprot:TRINITY_DN1713_c0_g1_i1.p1 TRINITY_DN1713_c0_g1~~TRINITY_DN1713_c0_g1_i1.p1  ORF type:complete len:838 (+),score=124.72 TRINITY_DN1713_c0_g1_i1:87-2600(+)
MDKEVIDLINLGEFTNNFLNDNGKVTFNSYLAFWESIPEKSTLYLAVLLTKILSIQNGEDKLIPLPEYVRRLAENTLPKELDGIGTARAIEIDEKGVEMHSRLLTTAYFISLFYSNSSEFQPFFTALARFNIFREAQKVRPVSSQLRSNEFLFSDEISRLHSTPNYLLSFDGLKFLIQQLTIIDFPADYNFKSMSSNYVAPSLVNPFLRRALLRMDRQFTNMLFDVTIDYFRHPSLSEEMVLALMHTFKSYLTAVPHPPASLMKKALERLKQYYLWPKPYSEYAKDVLDLITLEIRAPGAGYRSRFVEEFPHLVPHPSGSEYPITGKERTAYLIIDKDCGNAYAFSEILNTYKPRVPTDLEIHLGILSNIFIGCLNTDPATLNLGYCNEGDIASLCTEAVSIMNQTLLIRDEKEAEAFRTKELLRLKEIIMKAPKNSQLTSEIVPPRVPLDFVTKVIDCSNESLKTQSYSSNSSVRQYHLQRPSFQLLDEIIGQVYNSLKDFNFIAPARRPFVRIGIVGNDSTVHNILSAYLGMRITRPDYFHKLDVRFFLIPIDDCHLAGFMGRQDKWYGRQIACLTKCIFGLYPSSQGTGFINLDEEVAKVKTASYPHPVPSPAYVLRAEIENYLREARWPLNMTIFQCECFKTVFETTSVVIPFAQRAEVGMNIANMSSKDVNATRMPPALLCLKFLHVNAVGVPRMSRPTEPRMYETISMSAVSWSPEEGKDAHPSRTWLEMYIRESDAKEKKKKDRSTKEKSSSKNKTEDSKKGKSGRSYHVANVEIEPQDKTRTFEIMLDGIIYGPFAKIKIVPAADNATDTIYSFPMMSYLPSEEEEIQP